MVFKSKNRSKEITDWMKTHRQNNVQQILNQTNTWADDYHCVEVFNIDLVMEFVEKRLKWRVATHFTDSSCPINVLFASELKSIGLQLRMGKLVPGLVWKNGLRVYHLRQMCDSDNYPKQLTAAARNHLQVC